MRCERNVEARTFFWIFLPAQSLRPRRKHHLIKALGQLDVRLLDAYTRRGPSSNRSIEVCAKRWRVLSRQYGSQYDTFTACLCFWQELHLEEGAVTCLAVRLTAQAKKLWLLVVGEGHCYYTSIAHISVDIASAEFAYLSSSVAKYTKPKGCYIAPD